MSTSNRPDRIDIASVKPGDKFCTLTRPWGGGEPRVAKDYVCERTTKTQIVMTDGSRWAYRQYDGLCEVGTEWTYPGRPTLVAHGTPRHLNALHGTQRANERNAAIERCDFRVRNVDYLDDVERALEALTVWRDRLKAEKEARESAS